ncbi:gamma-glutamyltransferase [Rudaeicoccus suwonensis]|uniref:Gamma-glutamyltranspeptidase/glutathione hydrolase n=1 Tax=Rudaeicoccus suwonensis TaxID=657409 RepID=A0A561DX76_9MICO|nr:gamma-glutamyltransferase [Rudaeicoccus suwonensis]TWE07964.1 gamma-glutamyltranspeptidase/glutathione hydrolase [Rudaeicoccus suwonensis]
MTSARAAIAAPNALAAQAGLDVIAAGGTAVDAAIAAQAVTYVTEPGIVSALGGAFVNVWPANADPQVIDGNCEMPGRGAAHERFGTGLRNLHLDYGGGITINAGAGSAATPGSFAAYELARARFGAAPWADILAPAIAACRTGFRLGQAAGSYLRLVGPQLYGFDPVTRAQHFVDDEPVGPGARMTNTDLADTLEIVAAEGSSALYTGDIAGAIAAHVQLEGGLIGAADLSAYTAVCRPAGRTRLHDWDVALNPPPSIGGPVLTAMLRLLARRSLAPDELIAVQTEVLQYRHSHLDRAADLTEAGAELLRALQTNNLASLPTSTDTAHVSVVDSEGMACAITTSAGYSSGVTIPGTGLILNNCLGEPELNRRGLHALPPGTRLASNMAPTTARCDDGAVLAIGSPGADRITTALMQVLGRYCLTGDNLQAAIDAPRLHAQPQQSEDGPRIRIDYEPDDEIASAVAQLDCDSMLHEPLAMFFGGVGAALRTANGDLLAAADPRRAAATAIG